MPGLDLDRSSIRCGVFLLGGRWVGQDDTAALARAAEAVVAAEEAGFDSAWIAEHHFIPYGTCPSAITFAAHALGRTREIRIGTAVSVLSTTHPVALAEQVALVDQLSGGRFTLGVGRGGPWIELDVLGTGLDRYETGFAETLDLLLQGLDDGHVAADGDHFHFPDVELVPRPRTRPRPPVVVGCTSTGTVELAAERGLPMLLGLHVDDDEKADLVDHYAKAARAAGRDPGAVDHVAAAVAHVADTRADAVDELMAALPGWLADSFAAYVRIDDQPAPRRDPVAYAERLCALHPVGPPDHCIRRLRRSAAITGIHRFILLVEGSGTRHGTLRTIARLGDEVLPYL
jgi:alkanesulfonate monooxygenase SsuD/methylene tetrahydromethanopterin reductase-like flavin-dependent oxidoreductase (luciferase family)